jgi:2,5-diketo-D-gluconate reductase A
MANATSRTLTTDIDIPFLGFGTFLMKDDEAAVAVEAAITAGYRHIDTAEVYENERGVGEGLQRGLTANNLARGDVFVTTKLWPYAGDDFKTGAQVHAALDESLQKLGLDSVDLYLIHAPFNEAQRLEQWAALVELKNQGKARAVGVSNFNTGHIDELLAAGLEVPAADQVELHPWSQKPELVRYLEDKSITPIAYSSLVPLSTWRSAPGHPSGKTDAWRAEGEEQDSFFKTLAARYGVTEAQILLRWGIQSGYPVLPKSTNADRIRQNADLFSFEIDADDMAAIAQQDRGQGVAWGAEDPIDAA